MAILKEALYMLRNRMDQPYSWIIVWVILALLLLLAEGILFPQPAIAFVDQVKEIASAFLLQIFQFIR
jgi:hypothetical protein